MDPAELKARALEILNRPMPDEASIRAAENDMLALTREAEGTRYYDRIFEVYRALTETSLEYGSPLIQPSQLKAQIPAFEKVLAPD